MHSKLLNINTFFCIKKVRMPFFVLAAANIPFVMFNFKRFSWFTFFAVITHNTTFQSQKEIGTIVFFTKTVYTLILSD